MWALEVSASLALAASVLFSAGSVLAARRPSVGSARLSAFLGLAILAAGIGMLTSLRVLAELRAFWLLLPGLLAIGVLVTNVSVVAQHILGPEG